MAMNSELEKVIRSVEALPTLPAVVSQVSQLANNPKSSAKQLSEVVSRDQALASKVLKLANSTFYGFPQRISTVTHAVVVLGFNTIKNIVLTVSVFQTVSGGRASEHVGLWEHSLGCGVAAELVGQRAGMSELEELFVAGLLHDLGKVVLSQYLPQEYEQVRHLTRNKGMLAREAEEQVYGCDHARVGEMVAAKWKFPGRLRKAIALHHRPAAAGDEIKATAAVHIGDIICRARLIGFAGDYSIPRLNRTAAEVLGITPADFRPILSVLGQRMRLSSEFLSLLSRG
jgi:HD-like signal output (HDOD) protein